MRITLVISSLGAGGAERVMTVLANYWSKQGDVVSMITMASKKEDFYALDESVRRYALKKTGVTASWYEKISRNLNRLLALRASIQETSPDIILSFTDEMNVQTLMAAWRMGVPVIVSERIDPRHHKINCIWSLLRTYFYRYATAVVVQTDTVNRWVCKNWHLKWVETIANPLKSRSCLGEAIDDIPDSPYILAIGRLVPQKGFDLLLKAFCKISKNFPKWKLVILGDGEQKKDLELLADQLMILDKLCMPGTVSSPETWMKKASIFALSSRFEGFPNVLLEAMSYGLASVSFDCPSGPGDIIQPDINGILVPTEDIDAFADAIKRLIESSSLRRKMGCRARGVKKRFSLPRISRQWRQLFNEIIDSGKDNRKTNIE